MRRDNLRKEFEKISFNPSFKDLIFCDQLGKELKTGIIIDKATHAAENKKIQKDLERYWYPIIHDNLVLGIVGSKSNNEDTKEKVNLIKGILDEFSYKEYLTEEVFNSLDNKGEFLNQIFTTDEITNFEDAIDRGDILGLNLRYPQAIILIKIPGIFLVWHKKGRSTDEKNVFLKTACTNFVTKIEANFFKTQQNSVLACISEDTFVCLASINLADNNEIQLKKLKKEAETLSIIIEKETKIIPTIGIGQFYPSFYGLKKSYVDALCTINIGERIWGAGKIYTILDIGMLISIEKDVKFNRKCELALQILGPVLNDDTLFKTVNTFLDSDMSLSLAAKKLHLHRNTLIYRLDKIQTLINLDPRNFNDAIQIKLGILLYGPSIRCH